MLVPMCGQNCYSESLLDKRLVGHACRRSQASRSSKGDVWIAAARWDAVGHFVVVVPTGKNDAHAFRRLARDAVRFTKGHWDSGGTLVKCKWTQVH